MFARALLPFACLALSGCFTMQQDLTPWQRCLYGHTGAYRSLRMQAREARANLARGYKLVPRTEQGVTVTSCPDSGAWGTCLGNVSRRTESPVAIDPAREKARLRRLNARVASLRPKAAAEAYAACGPEP